MEEGRGGGEGGSGFCKEGEGGRDAGAGGARKTEGGKKREEWERRERGKGASLFIVLSHYSLFV